MGSIFLFFFLPRKFYLLTLNTTAATKYKIKHICKAETTFVFFSSNTKAFEKKEKEKSGYKQVPNDFSLPFSQNLAK